MDHKKENTEIVKTLDKENILELPADDDLYKITKKKSKIEVLPESLICDQKRLSRLETKTALIQRMKDLAEYNWMHFQEDCIPRRLKVPINGMGSFMIAVDPGSVNFGYVIWDIPDNKFVWGGTMKFRDSTNWYSGWTSGDLGCSRFLDIFLKWMVCVDQPFLIWRVEDQHVGMLEKAVWKEGDLILPPKELIMLQACIQGCVKSRYKAVSPSACKTMFKKHFPLIKKTEEMTLIEKNKLQYDLNKKNVLQFADKYISEFVLTYKGSIKVHNIADAVLIAVYSMTKIREVKRRSQIIPFDFEDL